MHYYCGFRSQFWLHEVLSQATYQVVFPECTCAERPPTLSPASAVDFVLHPAAAATATAAPAPTLSFGALVNVVGDEAALRLRAGNVLVIVALGVLGRKAGVLRRHGGGRAAVQFGNVAKGVRSLYGVRRDRAPHLRFGSAGVGLRLPPGWDAKAVSVRGRTGDGPGPPLLSPLSVMSVAEDACSCYQEQQRRNGPVKDVGNVRERL